MGVYIKNMEMPKSCYVCPFMFHERRQLDVWCTAVDDNWLDLREIICGERHPSCPLIHVPPHGRLIDADALIEKCEEMADKEDGNQLDALVLLRWFLEQNAPTVIPAEEGE